MTDTEMPVVVEAPPTALSAAVAWGTPKSLDEAIRMAKLVSDSGIVPKDYAKNPGAVLVAMQMGAELGMAPMASLQNIAVINGRPSLWGDAILAVVKARPSCEWVAETFDDETMTATCQVKRRGNPVVTCTFSQQDAETAGLWKKAGPWQQYPRRMLQMRARAFACRDAFPDALRGLAVAEEAMDAPRPVDYEDVTPPPQGATATEKLKNRLKKKGGDAYDAGSRNAVGPERDTNEASSQPIDRAELDARYNAAVRSMAAGDDEKHAKILDDLDEQAKEKHGVPVDGLKDDALRALVEGLEAKAR